MVLIAVGRIAGWSELSGTASAIGERGKHMHSRSFPAARWASLNTAGSAPGIS
jgi:hypothetical protein